MLPATFNKMLQPTGIVSAANGDPNLYLAGTDAWISVPGSIPIYHPDPMAEPPFTTYMFGFRDVTGMNKPQKEGQKGKGPIPLTAVLD